MIHKIRPVRTCAIFLLFHFYAYGHSVYYKNAVVIKNDSSILTGFVEKYSESALSLEVNFKYTPDEKKETTLPISEINCVIFTDDSSVFCKVPYHHIKDSKKIVEYRLAKKLLEGYADLYKLQLPLGEQHIVFETGNTFVYIVEINGRYHVLDQTERLEGMTCRIRKGYVGVLRNILETDCPPDRELNKLKFRDDQIIPLIHSLNRRHKETPCKKIMEKESPEFSHIPFAGYTMAEHLEGGTNASGFEAGYALSTCHPEISERFSYSIGVSINRLTFTKPDRSQKSYLLIKVPLYAEYRFGSSVVSPFVTAGFAAYAQWIQVPIRLSTGAALFNTFSLECALESLDPLFRMDRIWTLYCRWRIGGNQFRPKQQKKMTPLPTEQAALTKKHDIRR